MSSRMVLVNSPKVTRLEKLELFFELLDIRSR